MKIRCIWGILCLGALALVLVFAALWYTAPRPLDDFSDNFDFSQAAQLSGDADWYVAGKPGGPLDTREVTMTLEPGDLAFDDLVSFLADLRCGRTLDSLLPRPSARYAAAQEGAYRWTLRLTAPEGPDPGLLALSVFGGRAALEVSRAGQAEPKRWYIDLGKAEQDWIFSFLQTHGQRVDVR